MHIILTPTSAAYYLPPIFSFFFFFFNDPPTTEIYTLSLHDALPTSGISGSDDILRTDHPAGGGAPDGRNESGHRHRGRRALHVRTRRHRDGPLTVAAEVTSPGIPRGRS